MLFSLLGRVTATDTHNENNLESPERKVDPVGIQVIIFSGHFFLSMVFDIFLVFSFTLPLSLSHFFFSTVK